MNTLEIDLCRQQLHIRDRENVLASFMVSTSTYGVGETSGSECTPRGRHVIRACIGTGLPAGACFTGRRFRGELWTPALARSAPHRDWVLSRIIWLGGCEPGRNRFGSLDTMRRYIYIHGTPDTEPMGVPRSHGCIRMRNDDVITLFDRVAPGMSVNILA